MKLRVLFFGATRDIVGKHSIDIDIESGSTSREALDNVLNDYPRLSSHKLLFAVNMEYGDGSEVLKNGDELAVFTAVSGG